MLGKRYKRGVKNISFRDSEKRKKQRNKTTTRKRRNGTVYI